MNGFRWGWGFIEATAPPHRKAFIPDRKVTLVQGNTKKETEVSPRLINFILLMYKQLIPAQRYHPFVEHQNRGTRKAKTQKEIAAEMGISPSTVCREYKRNATRKGGYNDRSAQLLAESRRKHGTPHNKTPRLLLWRIEQWIKDEQWSPAQIVGVLAKEGISISRQTMFMNAPEISINYHTHS